jgi:hypothetical protein
VILVSFLFRLEEMSLVQEATISAVAESLSLKPAADAIKSLAPDVEYRLREVVQVIINNPPSPSRRSHAGNPHVPHHPSHCTAIALLSAISLSPQLTLPPFPPTPPLAALAPRPSMHAGSCQVHAPRQAHLPHA